MRRAALVAAAALLLAGGTAAIAHADEPVDSVVLRVHGVSLRQLLGVEAVRTLATGGGAALLAHTRGIDELLGSGDPELGTNVEDLGSGSDGLAALDTRLNELALEDPTSTIWVVSDGSGLEGDELGAVVVDAPNWTPGSSPRSLTSDSTRREGVVVSEDIRATMCDLAPSSAPAER